jgi:ABC-2 type transport system permease protein
MRFLCLYVTYALIFLKTRKENLFTFYANVLANFYTYFVTYMLLWAITESFGSIDGWGFEDITVLFGLNVLAYSISGALFSYAVYQIDNEIISGNLDSYLVRPMGIIQQMACRSFVLDAFLGPITVTVVFMAGALHRINYHMTAYSYVYLAAAIVSGVLIQSGAMIILGSLSFWSVHRQKIASIIFGEMRAFTNFPLSIYPEFIRRGLTYVLPWAIVNYYPSLIVLRKVETNEEFIVGLLSPLIGVCFFFFSLYVFNAGLKRYACGGSQ